MHKLTDREQQTRLKSQTGSTRHATAASPAPCRLQPERTHLPPAVALCLWLHHHHQQLHQQQQGPSSTAGHVCSLAAEGAAATPWACTAQHSKERKGEEGEQLPPGFLNMQVLQQLSCTHLHPATNTTDWHPPQPTQRASGCSPQHSHTPLDARTLSHCADSADVWLHLQTTTPLHAPAPADQHTPAHTHLHPATNTRLTGPARAAAYSASCSQGESASGEGGPKNVGATVPLLLPCTLLPPTLPPTAPADPADVPVCGCCCCCCERSWWHSSRGRV